MVVTRTSEGLTVRASRVTREIRFAHGHPSAVIPSSYVVAGKGNLFSGAPGIRWFELPVNGRVLTNRDSCWTFDGEAVRTLENGGTEVSLRFTATAPAAPLEWTVLMQLFPGSTLCREKIVFRAQRGTSARLTAIPGRPLFLFPGYMFRHDEGIPPEARIFTLAEWGRELIPSPGRISFDDRSLEEGTRVGRNLAQNYMYHPGEQIEVLGPEEESASPGPLLLLRGIPHNSGILFAYEHGAPDGDPEQAYLLIRRHRAPGGLALSTVYARGAFCPGQTITTDRAFESVWNVIGIFDGPGFARGTALFRDYLRDKITDAAPSRMPYFYYNTWGMQRDEERRGADVRGVLTTERVIKEIDLARKLNIDIFVLDDGWQERFGDWIPEPRRFPDGLHPYVEALRSRGMIAGIWIAPLATDPEGAVTRSHPEWLIRGTDGEPIMGRWQKNVFCFDSEYRDSFVRKCSELIDAGIRYFKWDGIDKYPCASPRHRHGTEANTPEERMQKQGFDLPLLVADAIRQLRTYNKDVIVEVDITEPYRSVGLAILSEGKYYWMNNGASWYGDQSTHRAKSMRFIPNLYHDLIPLPLQTYANYPHVNAIYGSWRNNVNSSLIGGWGFWGNLSLMGEADLERTGNAVALSKRVLRDVAGLEPRVTGTVGGAPEIYELVDREKAVGQIIGFSSTALNTEVMIAGFRTARMLAVVRNAYETRHDTLIVPFLFPMPEASREAFVLPNGGSGITIASSSSWLQSAELRAKDTLLFVPGAAGEHVIEWNPELGPPTVEADQSVRHSISGSFRITITSTRPGVEIRISGRK